MHPRLTGKPLIVTPAPGVWFAAPVAVNGSLGGSENYYVMSSTPQGLSAATPIPFPAELTGSFLRASVANGVVFFHGSTTAAATFDRGDTWEQLNTALPTDFDVFWNGNYYYCGTQRSADGITWATVLGLPSGTSYVVAKLYQNMIVAVRDPGGSSARVSTSIDDGSSWTDFPATLFSNAAMVYMTPGKLEEFRFTLSSTNGFRTLNSFSTVDIEVFGGQKPFYSGEADDVWIRKGSGNVLYRAIGNGSWTNVLSLAYGAGGTNNIAWGDGTWAALRNVAGSPAQRYVNWSTADGDSGSWTEEVVPIYGSCSAMIYLPPP